MELFEKEQQRLNVTANELRDRRLWLDEESRCIDHLEAQEATHQEGLSKIQYMVETLSSRYHKAKSFEGPQYFYIGDSEVEADSRKVRAASHSPSSKGKGPEGPLVPKLNLLSCRSRIQRTVERAEDAWEERRKVLQQQAEDTLRRSGSASSASAEATVEEQQPEQVLVQAKVEALSSRSDASGSSAGSWKRMISSEDDAHPDAAQLGKMAADVAVACALGEADHREEMGEKPTVWRHSKSFPRGVSGESQPESVHWVIPEPTPEQPMEDSELQLALQKRLRQVESSHCEFTKEGHTSHADVSWGQHMEEDRAVGVFTSQGRRGRKSADVPRDGL